MGIEGRKLVRPLAAAVLCLAAAGAGAEAIARVATREPAVAPVAESGFPPIQLYRPEAGQGATGLQSFAVTVDDRGLVWLANLSGLLGFDGARWWREEVPNSSSAQVVVAGPRGEVAVGAIDEIGLVVPVGKGAWRYRSLTDRVPAEDRPLGDVLGAAPTADGSWIFVSERAVWRWKGGELTRVASVTSPPAAQVQVFGLPGRVVLWSPAGLVEVAESGLVPLPGGERFAGRQVVVLLGDPGPGAAADGRWIAGLPDEGLVRFDADGERPFAPAASRWAVESDLTCGVLLPDGRMLLGSRRGGALFVGADGEAGRRVDAAAGLGDDFVRGFGLDREGGVWLALNGGLARFDLSSPVTLLDRRVGLRGTPLAIVRHGGRLYVGTDAGLFRLQAEATGGEAVIRPVPGVSDSVFALASAGDELLAGARDGVWEVGPAGARRVPGTGNDTVYALVVSKVVPGRVWVGLRRGLAQLDRSGSGWRFTDALAGSPRIVRSVAERGPDRLWLGTSLDGLVRAERSGGKWKFEQLGEGEFLFSQTSIGLLTFDGGLRRIDETDGERVEDPRLAALRSDDRSFFAVEDAHGRLWTNGPPPSVATPGPDGRYGRAMQTLFAVPSRDIQTIYPEPDGTVWLGGDRGLARFEGVPGPAAHRSGSSAPPIVRRITVGDRVVFAGAEPAGPAGVTLPERPERVRLELAPRSFAAGVQYQSRLEPLDGDWSPWHREPFVELAGLGPGAYRLSVRRRDAAREVSADAVWEFAVATPWWRKAWAVVLAVLAMGLLALAWVRFHTRVLELRAQRLEAEVASRTEELRSTVEQLRGAQAEASETNLQLSAANARLEALSLEDELTALANRRALFRRLEEEWSRARRRGLPISLVLFDLDHFKNINDTLGHREGDRALVRIGEYLRRRIGRPADLAARYGGEEFAVLLPETALEGALTVAEDLRRGVRELAVGTEPRGPGLVTASFGIAVETPEDDVQFEDLIVRADDALYRAKQAGRDRIEIAD